MTEKVTNRPSKFYRTKLKEQKQRCQSSISLIASEISNVDTNSRLQFSNQDLDDDFLGINDHRGMIKTEKGGDIEMVKGKHNKQQKAQHENRSTGYTQERQCQLKDDKDRSQSMYIKELSKIFIQMGLDENQPERQSDQQGDKPMRSLQAYLTKIKKKLNTFDKDRTFIVQEFKQLKIKYEMIQEQRNEIVRRQIGRQQLLSKLTEENKKVYQYQKQLQQTRIELKHFQELLKDAKRQTQKLKQQLNYHNVVKKKIESELKEEKEKSRQWQQSYQETIQKLNLERNRSEQQVQTIVNQELNMEIKDKNTQNLQKIIEKVKNEEDENKKIILSLKEILKNKTLNEQQIRLKYDLQKEQRMKERELFNKQKSEYKGKMKNLVKKLQRQRQKSQNGDELWQILNDILFRVQHRIANRKWEEVSSVFEDLDKNNTFGSLRSAILQIIRSMPKIEDELKTVKQLIRHYQKTNRELNIQKQYLDKQLQSQQKKNEDNVVVINYLKRMKQPVQNNQKILQDYKQLTGVNLSHQNSNEFEVTQHLQKIACKQAGGRKKSDHEDVKTSRKIPNGINLLYKLNQ